MNIVMQECQVIMTMLLVQMCILGSNFILNFKSEGLLSSLCILKIKVIIIVYTREVIYTINTIVTLFLGIDIVL